MSFGDSRRSKEPDPSTSGGLKTSKEGSVQQNVNGNSRASKESAQRRIWLWIVTLLLLGVLIGALFLSVPQLRSVADRWGDASIGWILLAIGFELLSCISYVVSFQLVFRRVKMKLASQIAWTQLAFGAVIPSGGASGIAVGAWIIKEKGGSLSRYVERSAVLYLLTSSISAFSLVFFGFIAGIGLLHVRDAVLLGVLPGAIVLIMIGLFLLTPAAAKRTDKYRGRRWQTALSAVGGVVRETLDYLIHPRWRLLGAIGYLWFDIAVMWACFRAIGIEPEFGTIVLAYLIGYVGNLIPIPGGIGVLDGGLVGALILYGISVSPATAVVLMYHALALWIPTLLGMVAFINLRRGIKEPIQLRPVK